MSDTALAYFAGLVDGEGCICIKRTNTDGRRVTPSYIFSLAIEMADPRAVTDFAAHFGLKTTISSSRLLVKPHHRVMRVCQVGGPRGVAILKALLPYLRCKREEAEVAIAFYEQTVANQPHNFMGKGKTRVPDSLLAQRHDFYLRLQALKTKTYATIDLEMP